MSNQSTSRNPPKQPRFVDLPEKTLEEMGPVPHREQPDEPPASKADYERYLRRARDAGNYFLFSRDYLHIMSIEAAVLCQSLLNLGRGTAQDGWVLCTEKFIQAQLGMARKAQDRSLRELREKGFITTRVIGIPPRRSVRVNVITIEKAIDKILRRTDGNHDENDDPDNRAYDNQTGTKCTRTDELIRDHGGGINNNGLRTPVSTKQGSDKETRSHAARADRTSQKPPENTTVVSTELTPRVSSSKDKRERRHCVTDAIDREWSNRLREYGKSKGWVLGRGPTRWEQPFAVLRRRVGEVEVERILSLYIELEITSFTIKSGREMERQWDDVCRVVERARAARPLPAEAVSAEAKDLVATLDNLNWPEAHRAQLATAVQRSIGNVKAFVAVASDMPNRNIRDSVLDEIGSPAWHVEQYFRDVFRQNSKWRGWDRNLLAWVWTPAAKFFDGAARLAISRHTGNGADFDALLAFVNEREKQS